MKKKSASEGSCNLKKEYFTDFVSSQTADNKIKTAADPQSHSFQWKQSLC